MGSKAGQASLAQRSKGGRTEPPAPPRPRARSEGPTTGPPQTRSSTRSPELRPLSDSLFDPATALERSAGCKPQLRRPSVSEVGHPVATGAGPSDGRAQEAL